MRIKKYRCEHGCHFHLHLRFAISEGIRGCNLVSPIFFCASVQYLKLFRVYLLIKSECLVWFFLNAHGAHTSKLVLSSLTDRSGLTSQYPFRFHGFSIVFYKIKYNFLFGFFFLFVSLLNDIYAIFRFELHIRRVNNHKYSGFIAPNEVIIFVLNRGEALELQ